MQKALQQKVGFGTALPNGGWVFMADKDPHPRIPFCVEEPVSKGEAIGWTLIAMAFLSVMYGFLSL